LSFLDKRKKAIEDGNGLTDKPLSTPKSKFENKKSEGN
jgi:hypothetical protein